MKLLTIIKSDGTEHCKVKVEDSSVDAFILNVESGKVWNTLDENGIEIQTYKVFLIEDITIQHELEERISFLVSKGEPDDLVCRKCINLIRGYNRDSNLSSTQIFNMLTSFSSIDLCLKNGMAKQAKSLIAFAVADGIIVKQELITLLLEILKEY